VISPHSNTALDTKTFFPKSELELGTVSSLVLSPQQEALVINQQETITRTTGVQPNVLKAQIPVPVMNEAEDDLLMIDLIENILDLSDDKYPVFTLAKNKARFLRMLTWYKQKETWLDVAPLSGVSKLFKQQTKELEGIRAHKLDYEMELETGTLTPSQRSYRRDELKMCKVHEKMAVHLIAKMQVKIKSGRR
jgi:hypothetical protein